MVLPPMEKQFWLTINFLWSCSVVKIIRLLLITLTIVSVFLAGCSAYQNKESFDFYKIEQDADNMHAFLDSITTYAKKYDEGLILGSIQLVYNFKDELEIDFVFTKKISPNQSASLIVYYDASKQGVIYSDYVLGSPKVYPPYDEKLDTTRWKKNFSQAFEELKKIMAEKRILSFKRIGCDCYGDEWLYRIFLSDNYEDSIEISLDPTIN